MTAKIKLNAASGGGSVSLKAPSTTTSNAAVELQLPVADGSADQFIKTDGSGNLSFGAAGGGKIVQVKYALKTDTFESTSTSYVDITGLSVTITPTSTSNYILIYACINGNTNGSKSSGRLMRDSTAIGIGDASGSRVRGTFDFHNSGAGNRGMNVNAMWVEQAQSTNSTVYKVQMRHENGSQTFQVGRQYTDSDNASSTRVSNSLVVMEFQP